MRNTMKRAHLTLPFLEMGCEVMGRVSPWIYLTGRGVCERTHCSRPYQGAVMLYKRRRYSSAADGHRKRQWNDAVCFTLRRRGNKFTPLISRRDQTHFVTFISTYDYWQSNCWFDKRAKRFIREKNDRNLRDSRISLFLGPYQKTYS